MVSPAPTRRLPVAFFRRPALEVAPDLLGRTLCRRRDRRDLIRGRIVEVEVYDGPDDRASHAYRGMTPRNRPMFSRGGIAYVYFVYGMHHCLNVVTGETGYPAAILIRAAEISRGSRLASGPGRLCRAFAIDRSLDGVSLSGRVLWLEEGRPVPPDRIAVTPRVGVDYAGEWADRPYRFLDSWSSAVSGPRRRGARPLTAVRRAP